MAQIVKERNTRAKKAETKTKEATFPVKAFINKYNFLRISPAIRKALDWPEGVQINVSIDLKDGALVISKKSA